MGVQNPPQDRVADNIQFFDRIVRLFPVSYYAPEIDDAEGVPTEQEETKVLPATPQASSLSELRERLQAKVQSMKQPRTDNDENPHKRKRKKKEAQEGKQDKKPTTTKKQKVESEKKEGGKEQKVTVKKQKGGQENQKEKPAQERKSAKKEKTEKQQSVEKQSVEKQQTEGNKQKRKNDKSAEKAPKTQAAKPAPVAIVKEAPTQPKKKQKQLGQDLMFSSVTMDTPKEQLENLPGSSKKNAHRALRKVLSFEKKVQELKQDNPDAAREIVKQASVSAALNRVQGIKVHDDKARLAKALKRKEKSKQKSQKEWNERSKQVASQTKQTAQKRNDNVKAKLAERSANRLKKSIKKRGDVRALLASAGS